MKIQKYDFYQFRYNKSSNFIDIRFEDHPNNPYCITNLFHKLYPREWVDLYAYYITLPDFLRRVGKFPGVEVTLDPETNLVYISDAYEDDYRIRMRDVTQADVLEFCKNNELDFQVMTYENFLALISAWDKLLTNEPKFALLYQNENDWYDLLPFDDEQDMKQFTLEHLQQ